MGSFPSSNGCGRPVIHGCEDSPPLFPTRFFMWQASSIRWQAIGPHASRTVVFNVCEGLSYGR
eukprot:2210507-Lingulodinium_polyedra.AAC.1